MSTKILKLIISISLFILFNNSAEAQETLPCGHDHIIHQWWSKNPTMKEQYNNNVEKIKDRILEKSKYLQDGNRNNKITIPVVFHVLHLNGAENISEVQIQDQIRILNRDYQKGNSDTSLVVSAFKNKIADIGFEFQLAKLDPEGNCTNGIVRHYTSKTIWNSEKLEDFTYTWPPNKYLNIYVVKKIDIAPAYTFLPGIGIPDYADAIVCESWLVGSVGTASVANSRVLTHEVGHWFGLPHIWGVSNAPGVSCGDDFVEDTPVTKGFVSCSINNAKICDPNIIENVQNYMDYSPCKLMFTNGQSAYMHETISLGLNKRDHLVSEENLMSTGILGDKPCTILADFYSVFSNICKGESIKFFSQSQTGSGNSALTWKIEGGFPSFSNDTVVEATFPEAGKYEVKLIVSGSNGMDSISKFIQVFDGNNGYRVPFYVNFDDGKLPSEIQLFNNQPMGVQWETLTDIGANSTNGCIFLNNAKAAINAYFETPFFDFTENNKPGMSFYYAYAKNTVSQVDSFRLEFTMDCGKTWKIFPGIPSTNTMANNTGGVMSTPFFPGSSDQWKKITLNNNFQALFKNKPSVKFRFYFKSDPNGNGSNNIFIDEINITNESISAIQGQEDAGVHIFPNPSNSGINIEVQGTGLNNCQIEIGSLTRSYLDKIIPELVLSDKVKFVINKYNNMSAGIYYVKVKKAGFTDIVRKIVILE